MKKLIFRGPVQTASGYGVHARMLLKALDESGKFDITVLSVPWGATPLIYEDTPEQRRIKELAQKFNPQQPMQFDMSVQVTIPPEFQKMAPLNVGVTAGIETDRVCASWQTKTNESMDVLVVPSVHSAASTTKGIYGAKKGPEQVLLRKPLYVLPEWIDTEVYNTGPTKLENWSIEENLKDMPDFNFVACGLGLDKADGEDRKNFAHTIKWFCEQFRNSEDVGLVLKMSMVNYSEVDFKHISQRIKFIKAQAGCGQFPKIKLIHGRLSDLELAALYKHPKVKAFITLTHGEGYGLPIIEAAACGLPVIATNWSGHLDFLQINGKNKFVPVDFTLQPIPQSAVWENVMDAGTNWAVPVEADAKMKMAKVVLSYAKPKEWAMELAAHINKTFTKQLGVEWAEDMYKLACGEKVKLTKNPLVQTAKSEQTLPVTLVAVTDGNFKKEQTQAALEKSKEQIKFADEKWIITQLGSVAAYDKFVAKHLHTMVNTSHALLVQWDGYVLNGSAWNDEFLKYDYVGAPWFWNPAGMNSGFVLLSKKLLEELSKDEYEFTEGFDVSVCNTWRAKLEERGFKFAPVDVASKFSVENLPYVGQFGWHGENPFNGDV